VLIWRTCWGTHCELGEPIRNLEGTHWETGQNENKNPSHPPNLKGIKARHLQPSHWLKGKQFLLAPQIKVAWKVQCPSGLGHWTVHYPHQIILEEKNLPSNLPRTPKFGDLVTSPIN